MQKETVNGIVFSVKYTSRNTIDCSCSPKADQQRNSIDLFFLFFPFPFPVAKITELEGIGNVFAPTLPLLPFFPGTFGPRGLVLTKNPELGKGAG